jgi:ABC-type nitrate/sulfonate/bicarbonate transport system substrate-binding protein
MSRAGSVAALVSFLTSASFACGPVPPESSAAPVIRVAHLGEFGFGDLPTLVAHERLRARGYVIESTHYAAGDLLFQALARGDADFGNGALTSAWSAMARGARLRTVMEHVANPHRLVAAPGVRSCDGLHGRRLGLHTHGGVVNALIAAFMAEECPEARAETLHIEESSGRAAALLSGAVDAAGIDLNLALWLEEQAPDRFIVLTVFAERWPGVKTLGLQVNTDYAAANPALVTDYVRTRVMANRELNADVDLVVASAERWLGPSPRWPAVAHAYVGARAWDPDGGLREVDVAHTLEFFSTPALSKLSPGDVADLRFLRDALESEAP